MSQMDHATIAAYFSGEMDEDEVIAFEESYIANPEMLEQLEAEWILRQGFAPGAKLSKGYDTTVRWRWAAGLAIAASLVLLVANVGQSWRMRDLQERVAGGDEVNSSTLLVRIAPLRSATETGSEIVLDGFATSVVLIFELPYQVILEHEQFDVSIEPEGLDPILVNGLRPQGSGEVVIVLPRDRLTPGEYSARALAEGSDIANFSFKISNTP